MWWKPRARARARQKGDVTEDVVLAESEVQFGLYWGQTFQWLLGNAAGYAVAVLVSHQKEREAGDISESPLMENKDALASYARLFPPMVTAVARLSSAAAAAPPPPPPPPSKRKRRKPEWTPPRVTLCRMKSRMRQDDRVLEAEKGKPRCQPGDPCPICGRPRTLDTGHTFFKRSFYCDLEEGPGAPTALEWLASQQGPGGRRKAPQDHPLEHEAEDGEAAEIQLEMCSAESERPPGKSRQTPAQQRVHSFSTPDDVSIRG
ncbi:unnamed protein product [Merluccius merluccius]